jgi:hypothetical protein
LQCSNRRSSVPRNNSGFVSNWPTQWRPSTNR